MSKEFEELVLKELKELKKDNGMIFKQLKEQEKNLKEFRKETTNRFNILERTVTIIEDEVKNKIPALFNADLTRQQKENSLQSEVDHLR